MLFGVGMSPSCIKAFQKKADGWEILGKTVCLFAKSGRFRLLLCSFACAQ